MERAHEMPEKVVSNFGILVTAWGGFMTLLAAIGFFYARGVRQDITVLHGRVDGCEEDHLTVKESELKDKLAAEKEDRMIAAVVKLEDITEDLRKGMGK
ncbi:MAG: hypothetical protein KAJ07_00505 [Planctomycetes bacterium]|nr:hypothetical protein [Planctomycetota bacterium]